MNILVIILSSLAVWRVTHMVQDEDGPFAILARLQAWAAKRPERRGGINEGFFCFYCLSTWVSILPALFLATSIPEFFLLWFGIGGLAIFLNILHDRTS